MFHFEEMRGFMSEGAEHFDSFSFKPAKMSTSSSFCKDGIMGFFLGNIDFFFFFLNVCQN